MGKKDGLYLGIGLFSSILCVMLFKMINMFDFDVNMGIPFIVGILLLNNIIIHSYLWSSPERDVFKVQYHSGKGSSKEV